MRTNAWIAAVARSVVVPAVLVVAFLAFEWLVFDVSFRGVALFIGYELGFILVPGVLLYITISGRAALGLEQIALGWALGYALELTAFTATAAADHRSILGFYPVVVAAVCVPFVVVKIRQQRFERIDVVAKPWIWAVALLQIVLIAYMGDLVFARTPPPQSGPFNSYYQDQVWFISLAAEARHHWPLQLPNLAGIPLRYHYFLNLHLASINQVTGLSLFQGVFRLYLPPLLILVPLQFAYAARVLGSTAGAGVVGCALFFLLSAFGPGFSIPNLFFPDESQVLYSTVFFLPAAILVARALQERPAWLGWRQLALLLTFLVAGVGAKATTIPVFLGGLGLLALYALVADRGLIRRLLVPAATAGAILLAALLTLYRDSEDVEKFQVLVRVRSQQPFNWLATQIPNVLHVHALLWAVASVFAILKVTSGLWLGLAGVWTGRGRGADRPRLWFCALLLAGILIFLSTEVSGGSEVYFYVFGHEAGCVVAGVGLVLLWQRFVRPIPIRAPALAAAVLVALLVWGINKPYDTSPHNFWLSVTGQIRKSGYTLGPSCDRRDLSPALYQGLRWVAAHSRTDAVLAVSNQYQARLALAGGCKSDSRYFYYSAFAERRVMLEGYYKNGGGTPYPPKSVAERDPAATPYPDRFRLNNAIFLRGDGRALRQAKRRFGVNYLVADKLHGLDAHQVARVRRLGNVVFANSAVEIIAV